MPVDFYLLVLPFCVIPVFLVSIDYYNKSAEQRRKRSTILEFDKFLKLKEAGDAIDNDIAELLDIEKIVA